jgi:predicted AlkP superfamily pyrophosphatase or phosphodiesterase
VVRGGSVDRHLRMVDVAPTLTALLGAPAPSAADGSADHSLLSGDVAESVVVFLLDGANPDALADAMAAGLTPNLAGLVERGVHYTGGVLASFPTATLANHTTALTGAHPGRSGILHNTWHDRAAGATRDLLELQQMFASVEHLLDSVETVHEVVHRHRPDAFTFTTYEYADRGADWSTYRCFRNGEAADDDGAAPDPHMDADWGAQRWYRQMSRVDASSTRQAVRFWNGHNPVPTFGWVTFNLTDKCGHHEGPHSDAVLAAFTETDARIGDVITAIDRAGRLDRTTFVALADHGMALTEGEASLVVTAALGSAGIDAIVCDETFVYLTGK